MTYDANETAAQCGLPAYDEVPEQAPSTGELTGCWGDPVRVSSYLNRCQVDTPMDVVRSTWAHVQKLRPRGIGKVIDLGAGDGRFAHHGAYGSYVGYEIDADRCSGARLPSNATLLNQCAFTDLIDDADVCVGNPPFVRYQEIPDSWREKVRAVVRRRTGVHVSGLANAWQYFFLNGLASLGPDGVAALVVPFEWVSRPAARALRACIGEHQWNVYVYRLRDALFPRVLTTASITVVDKAEPRRKVGVLPANNQRPESTSGFADGLRCQGAWLCAGSGPSGGGRACKARAQSGDAERADVDGSATARSRSDGESGCGRVCDEHAVPADGCERAGRECFSDALRRRRTKVLADPYRWGAERETRGLPLKRSGVGAADKGRA